jgi:MFS family permease
MFRKPDGLWQQPDFVKLWVGQAISNFGSHITWQALPLTAMLALGAGPTELGLLAAAGAAPVLFFGLVAGVWVDRLPRRPLMIAADLGRTVLLGSIPVAALLGLLTIFQLFVIAALAGLLTVFFDVADQSYLPSLVEHDQIMEGNSKITASKSLAEITGQPIGGLLVQVLTAPFAIAIDAVSFLVSAACLILIRKPENRPQATEETQPMLQEALEGLGVLFKNPIQRALALSDIQRDFFGSFIGTLYMVFIIRELQMPVWVSGVLVGVGGISSLVGSVFARRLTSHFGVGKSLIGSALITSLITLLIPIAAGPFWLAFGLLVISQAGDFGWSVFLINQTSLRQSITTERQLGRVNAGVYFLAGVAGLVGSILSGVLGDLIGVRATLFVAVAGFLTAFGWLYFSPVRHLNEIPEQSGPVEEPAKVVAK